MSTHVGVTAWFEEDGEESEQTFDYYGPVPLPGDGFVVEDEDGIPDGLYVVKRRTYHHPMRGWTILVVQAVDDSDEAEQTPDAT